MNGQRNTWSLFVFPRDSRQSWNEKTESDRTTKIFLSLIRPNGEFNQSKVATKSVSRETAG